MDKFQRLLKDLELAGEGQMKAFGHSMMPIIKSGSLLTFTKQESYKIDDIVCCKVKGRFMVHKIKRISDGSFLICNNKGRENGWTKSVFGKVTRIQGPNEN